MVTGDELIVKAGVRACKRCPLWNKEHGPVAFSEPKGSFVGPVRCVQGEAPGQTEDMEGKPFVGSSGKLLREYLINPDSYYYLNTVCCWPRRTPTRKESDACRQNLVDQLTVIRPDYLLILGSVALQAWWPNLNVSSVRGHWFELQFTGDHKCWAMVTWHPSYILRTGSVKDKTTWAEDIIWFNDTTKRLRNSDPALDQTHPKLDMGGIKKAPTAGMLQGPQLDLLRQDDHGAE
jgi:uracil-DNA glycosylase family 4